MTLLSALRTLALALPALASLAPASLALTEPDLKAAGAFGFPQKDATALCDTESLRVCAWNDASHLYVQAVLWTDPDPATGTTDDGRKIGDWSSLMLELDGDATPTAQLDRDYALNPWPSLPGLHYSVSMGGGGSTGLTGDSKGRGSIQYADAGAGRKVRVDCFLIPLTELGKKPGDSIRFAYWGSSPKPNLTLNSVGFKTDKPTYYSYHVPRKDYHTYTLADRAAALDMQLVPEGRGTIAVKARAALPKVGEEPPEVAAAAWLNWKDANAPSLKSLRGKVVVVEFWATWCGPCVAGIPHLNELHDRFGKDGVVILSLTDQEGAPIEKFVNDRGMKFTVGSGSETIQKYGVSGIPHAFVVGRDGKLAWEGHPSGDDLDKAIESALKAK